MSTWADGYNADIAYTHGVYRELFPGYLAYVCHLNSVRAPRFDRPFRYCELGCGQGMTLAMMAATHPQGRFVGIDFNPVHVAGARRLVEEAGLANVAYLERSFQDIAVQTVPDEERFDVIALHGVYSWISAENRRAVVDILERWLTPGGLVYISYNTQPGWAPLMPLQALMLEHAAAHPARSDRQLDAALDFIGRLNEAGAGYFTANPTAGQHLAAIAKHDRRYLTHEYLNTHWEPLSHARVARDLGRAKLDYAGSATIPWNRDDWSVRPELRAILAEIADPILAETARDFAMNQMFRRDLFVRGLDRMAKPETEAELRRQRVTLQVPRDKAGLAMPIPLGELHHAPDLGLPILDTLAVGTPSLDEIAALPELARHDFDTLSRFVSLLVSAGHAHPLAETTQEEERGAATSRLNRAITRRMLIDESLFFLAAPTIGTGVVVDVLERLTLTGLLDGLPAEPAPVAAFLTDTLRRLGKSVTAEDGVALTEAEPMRDRLTTVMAEALPQILPVWQRLGIV